MSQSTNVSTNQSTPAERDNEVSTLYDFTKQGKGKWRIQDDVVMGGRSDSNLSMTEDGNIRFAGRVSLENNGGFCSFQQTTENDPYVVKGKTAFSLLLKGDGKNYNFRVRTPNGRHAYAFTFETKGEEDWETITIPFSAMKATYRGRSIEVPNYAGENIEQIQVLIGNKKEENFTLVVSKIEVM